MVDSEGQQCAKVRRCGLRVLEELQLSFTIKKEAKERKSSSPNPDVSQQQLNLSMPWMCAAPAWAPQRCDRAGGACLRDLRPSAPSVYF